MDRFDKLFWTTISMVVLGIGIVRYSTPAPPPTEEAIPSLVEVATEIAPLLQARRYQAVIDRLEEVAALDPTAATPLIRVGQIYLTQHRWLMAEDAFNRALVRSYNHPYALAGLGEALLEQGRLEPAITVWHQAAAQEPIYNTGLGRSYLAQLDFEQATTAFNAHLNPESRWYLAALTAPQDMATAQEHLAAMNVATDSPLGHQHAFLSKILQSLTETGQTSPTDIATAVGVGLAQTEQWPLAYHALQQIEPANHTAETLAFLGHTNAQLALPAFDLFEQAYQQDPESPVVLSLQGQYLQEKGALQAAERRFGEAVLIDQGNSAAYAQMANLKAEQGQVLMAELWYETALELTSNKPLYQYQMAYFYLQHNYRLVDKGLPLAKRLVESDDQRADYQTLYGWMQFMNNEHHRAEVTLQKALELDPNSVRTRYYLAHVFAANGKIEQAITEYERVIDWDTHSGLRERAQIALQQTKERLANLQGHG